jgi:hypothetical protein
MNCQMFSWSHMSDIFIRVGINASLGLFRNRERAAVAGALRVHRIQGNPK